MLHVKDQLGFTPTENDNGIWKACAPTSPSHSWGNLWPSCREAIFSAMNIKIWFSVLRCVHLSVSLCAGRKVLERANRSVPAGSHLLLVRTCCLLLGLLLGAQRSWSCVLAAGENITCVRVAPWGHNSNLRGEEETPSQVPPREEMWDHFEKLFPGALYCFFRKRYGAGERVAKVLAWVTKNTELSCPSSQGRPRVGVTGLWLLLVCPSAGLKQGALSADFVLKQLWI